MSEQQGVVRAIAWRNVFPWLVLFRTFGLSVSLPLLFLATVGVLLTPLGWRLSELVFVHPDDLEQPGLRQLVEFNNRWPGQRRAYFEPEAAVPQRLRPPYPLDQLFFPVAGAPQSVFQRLVQPLQQLFDYRWPLRQFAYFLFGGLWMLVLWGFLGGAITRLAAVQLGREERVGLRQALWHATRKLGMYVVSPLFPLLGIVLVSLPIGLLALLVHAGQWGLLVVGIFWLLVLVGGFFMALLLLGLLFGWPLMWATLSVEEGGDVFEAFSRSYSYTFQRPLHYLFYAVLAAGFGLLGWLLVFYFSEAVIWLSDWAAAWGTGRQAMDELHAALAGQTPLPDDGPARWGLLLIGGSQAVVRTIAAAYSYSFFWCAATAIYLLLRQNVDQTEMDEVFLEDDHDRQPLPPLQTDQAGVPGAVGQGGEQQSEQPRIDPAEE